MNIVEYAPFVLEAIIFGLTVKLVSSLRSASPIIQIFLLFSSLAMTLSMIIGGMPALGMAIKVLLFIAALFWAKNSPLAARPVLIGATFLIFFIEVLDGNFYSKLTSVPFLLLAVFWILRKAEIRPLHLLIFVMAVLCEAAQAGYHGSRGGLAICFITLVALVVPSKFIWRTFVSLALVIPILYPVILSSFFDDMISGTGLIAPTASNYERSSMAAWSIENFSSYILVGPGGDIFTSEINFFKTLGRQALYEMYDPHHFVLSAWVFLGSLSAVVLYAFWSAFWILTLDNNKAGHNLRTKIFVILGLIGVVTFTVNPPDSSARLQVALMLGIALAGMRNNYAFIK